ncbi:hypothetical protein FRB95_013873 [Tulasnella sp. JGI-2019a]|nr:hypothetical protein FRB95_013873 [Tulasnella sp. JGI-2019a]
MPTDLNTFYTWQLRPSDSGRAQLKNQSDTPIPDNNVDLAIGLNYIDFESQANLRVKAYADNLRPSSATIHVDSWWDSLFNSGGCTWLEVGKNDRDFQCGVFPAYGQLKSCEISFKKPYGEPPKVVCWLNTIDIDHRHCCHIRTYAENITKTGFTLHISTWDDTVLHSAEATWIAYPPSRSNITSGSYDTMEVSRCIEPRARYERDILYDKTFHKAPLVLTALNMLDFEQGTPIKVKTLSTNLTERGMTWHLETWDEATLFCAGASYLAIQDY